MRRSFEQTEPFPSKRAITARPGSIILAIIKSVITVRPSPLRRGNRFLSTARSLFPRLYHTPGTRSLRSVIQWWNKRTRKRTIWIEVATERWEAPTEPYTFEKIFNDRGSGNTAYVVCAAFPGRVLPADGRLCSFFEISRRERKKKKDKETKRERKRWRRHDAGRHPWEIRSRLGWWPTPAKRTERSPRCGNIEITASRKRKKESSFSHSRNWMNAYRNGFSSLKALMHENKNKRTTEEKSRSLFLFFSWFLSKTDRPAVTWTSIVEMFSSRCRTPVLVTFFKV